MSVSAGELFTRKAPLVRRMVEIRSTRRRLSRELEADWLQDSLLALWSRCLHVAARGAGGIDCRLVVRRGAFATFNQGHRDRRRLGDRRLLTIDLDAPDGHRIDPPAPAPGVHIDGVRVTIQDAQLDFPELLELAEHGIPAADLAHRLGVSPQAVHQRRQRLGGVYFPGLGWRFPADAGRSVSC